MTKSKEIILFLENTDIKYAMISKFQKDLVSAFNLLLGSLPDMESKKDLINQLNKIRRDTIDDVEDTLLEHGFDYER